MTDIHLETRMLFATYHEKPFGRVFEQNYHFKVNISFLGANK